MIEEDEKLRIKPFCQILKNSNYDLIRGRRRLLGDFYTSGSTFERFIVQILSLTIYFFYFFIFLKAENEPSQVKPYCLRLNSINF